MGFIRGREGGDGLVTMDYKRFMKIELLDFDKFTANGLHWILQDMFIIKKTSFMMKNKMIK